MVLSGCDGLIQRLSASVLEGWGLQLMALAGTRGDMEGERERGGRRNEGGGTQSFYSGVFGEVEREQGWVAGSKTLN